MLPSAPVAAHDSSKLNEALLVTAVEADRLAMRAAELNRIPLSAQLFYRADQLRVASERLDLYPSSPAAIAALESAQRTFQLTRSELALPPL